MNRHASLNRAFRLVWNEARQAWAPAAETARARGKRGVRATVRLAPLLAALAFAGPTHAAGPPAPNQLPTGGKVVAGSATLASSSSATGAELDVNQTTSRAVIDWSTFDLGSAAQVDFNQPNASAATLNRVLDSNASQIFGKINAPGQVFLTNPNGVYFGKSASVDVGGLTATTSGISDADFMAGKITLSRNGATGSVANDGTLKASLGGYIALLAPEVRNDGIVVARMGTVVMAAGETVTLDFDGQHLEGITAQPSAIAALVENRSAVIAPGGLIILSAQAVDSLEGGVVKNSGTLEATGMAEQGGRIVLEASTSVVNTGTVGANAGAAGAPAGEIDITAPAVTNNGSITARGAQAPQSAQIAQAAGAAQATETAQASDAAAPGVPSAGGRVSISATTIEQTGSGLVDVSGSAGGSITLDAVQDIDIAGSLSAVGVATIAAPQGAASSAAAVPISTGGTISLSALHDITLQSALIDVSGDNAAGRIEVQGGSPAPSDPPSDPPAVALLGDTELDASSRKGKGGVVTLTAGNVNLLDTTSIDASGATGGGDVYVGGGFHGKDPSIADAQQTTVGSGVEIDASATQTGDGGQVVVWSSEQTDFAGSIQARGGAVSGSGGTLEVSGATLEFTGSVDAGAPHGTGGSLLLDPMDILIESGVGGQTTLPDGSGSELLFGTNASGTSTIDPSAITAITNTGTAVTLQASDDITIDSSIQTAASSGTGGALTFQAGRSITVNASVISDDGNITFSLNDPGANTADRNTGAATFTNNSVIDAGTGSVSITMGALTGFTSGNITTGQIKAGSLAITDTGTTAGTTIDIDETDLTAAGTPTGPLLTVSAASANPNLTNTIGTITVHGATTIDVGSGNVTITNPNTDFATIGFTAGDVDLLNGNAVKLSSTDVETLTLTTNGPIAQTTGSSVVVSGEATLTANYGGFGYADPYIDLMNSGNQFGSLALDVPTNGAGTGGYTTIYNDGSTTIASSNSSSYFTLDATGNIDTTGTLASGGAMTLDTSSGNIDIAGPISTAALVTLETSSGTVTTGATIRAGSLTVSATGAVSLDTTTLNDDLVVSTDGAITNTGAIDVPRQTELTAGSSNDITLDNAGNSFNYMRIVSADNVTLVDTSGMIFGNYGGSGGWTSTISGNLSVTAGGDINQVDSSSNNSGYSTITVDGATTFTANGTSAPINLYLGTTNPWGAAGQPNDFIGTITLAEGSNGYGFSNVDLRNTNAGASVLTGLTSVGTLSNVSLYFDSAPAVALPGMTVTGDLYVYAPGVANTASNPTNIISQAGAITVGNAATFETASTGDIELTNGSNDFEKYFGVVQARNVDMQTSGAVTLYAYPGYNENIYGNLTVTAGGNISDAGNSIYVQSGTASFSAAGNVSLTQNNVWDIVEFPQAVNVTLYPWTGVILGDSTISGTLTIDSHNSGYTLTQSVGTAVDMTTSSATTTFTNFTGGITLANADNVFGPLAISSAGAIDITENDAITQASAWRNYNSSNVGYAVTLTTTDDQAITLNQSSNYLGALTLTQNGASSTPGAVIVDNANSNAGITQPTGAAGVWTLAGATTLDSYGYSITLTNPKNVLGPLQVLSSAGTTNGVASSIEIYARNTATTDAITDVDAAGAWTTGTSEVVELVGYDSTGTTEGGGNITLKTAGNVLGELYLKGDSVTITENSTIEDGPVETGWDGISADGGWAISGATSLVVANPSSSKSINLTNIDNSMGPIALNTTGTAGTLSQVTITDDAATGITQQGVWNVGSAPVTLNAIDNPIDLPNAENVMGNINITTKNGVPSEVIITEDAPITQGSAWSLDGVPVTLATTNQEAITLGQSANILGDLVVTQNGTSATPGAVEIVENGPILQPAGAGGAWTTVGDTTLDTSGYPITLTNSANQFGPLAIAGTPSAVSLSAATDITQASAWVQSGVPFVLNSGSANIDLTESGNQLGALTLTGENATVTEAAEITEAAAWNIPGTTTLTAGSHPIVLTASPANNLGTVIIDSASNAQVDTAGDVTVTIDSASNADIDAAGSVTVGGATLSSGGVLTISAGGPIMQTGAIVAPSLQLIGAGYATLTDASNEVSTLAAGFQGGALEFTNSGDFAVGSVSDPFGNSTPGIVIGGHDVTLTSQSGTVTGLAEVNQDSTSLTVTSGTALTLPVMYIDGPQTYTAGGGGITLTEGVTSTAPGAITFESPVTLAADLTVQSDDSPITFGSTVAGANYRLGVNVENATSAGTVTFVGAVSDLGPTTSDAQPALSLTSGGAVFDTTLSANNGIAVTGPVTFSDTVTLGDSGAPTTFAGPVTLGKAGGMNLSGYNSMTFEDGVQLEDGPATIDSNDSSLTFEMAGTVSGPFALTLDSGAGLLTGLNRMGSDLTGLTVIALTPTIPTGGISIAGPQTYTATNGSNIVLDGNVTSTAAGAITFNSPVTMSGAPTVTSDDSPVVFGSTVDGNTNLTVNAGVGATATTTFVGAVGGITSVGSGTGAAIALQGSGATTFESTVQTRSGITSVGAVTFDGDVTLNNGDTGSTFGGLVTAGGTTGIDISGYDGIAFDGGLAVTGGAVSVSSNGSTLSLGGPVSGAESLTLDALAGGAGTVTGLGEIGTSSDLTALTVTGQTLSLPSSGLAVAGNMTFTAPGGITLNGAVGNSTTGTLSFDGPVQLATGPVALETYDRSATFDSTVDGAEALTFESAGGELILDGAVGGSTPLTSLTVDSNGGMVKFAGGSVTTTGAQTYGGTSDEIRLLANTTLTGDGIDLASTVDGAYALVIDDSGTTTFEHAVGASTPLTSLTDTAAQIVMGAGTVTTTGAQAYFGPMTLRSATTLQGVGLALGSTVDGDYALDTNAQSGALELGGAAGGSTPLASLTANGNTIATAAVTTSGPQTYTAEGGLTLGGDLTAGGNITVTGPTTLAADVTVSTGASGGNITFSGSTSTIDSQSGVNGASGYALTLDAGTGDVTLGAAVGNNAALTAVAISGYDLTLPDVTTVGDANQTYTALDDITLTQSRTLDAPISFTADAANNGTGALILDSGVSLTASNSNLTIQAANVELLGNSTLASGTGVITLIATGGGNIFVGGSDATPVSGQMTITESELSRMFTSGGLDLETSGAGWIEVDGIAKADSQNITGPLALLTQGTGDVSFITSPSTFNALTVSAGGTTNVAVDVTTNDGPIDFQTPVAISGASTIDSGGGNISFDDAVQVDNALTVTTANGTLTFAGPVGSNSTLTLNLGGGSVSGLGELQSTLTGLTVDSTSGITLPALTIDGPQVYDTGTITATGNLVGVGLTFNNVVDVAPASGTALTLDSGSGTLSFAEQVSLGANDVTLVGDSMAFGGQVAGSGALAIEPSTLTVDMAVGGSGTPIAGLNLTAADLALLHLADDFTSVTLGNPAGTGTLDVSGPLAVGSKPLTLNGGGGITESGGPITSGALSVYAAGNPIALANAANSFGAVAIAGTPSAVSLTDTQDIDQAGSTPWTLGSAALTLDAGTHDINLTNAGNTFGTLSLTGGNAVVDEAAATNLGASTLAGNLTLSSAGEVTQSGALAIGGNLTVSTSLAAGDVSIDNSGASATILGNTEVGGNYTITATDESISQEAGTSLQVVGNLTATGSSLLLTGAANLIGGTETLPATSTTVVSQAGVITLGTEDVTGNLTVISEATSRSFGSSQVSGTAILLTNSGNDIGGAISTSASPPTVTNNGYVETGIKQAAGTSLTVSGVASFTAEASSAGTVGIALTNSGNHFGTLELSGDTVSVSNSATGTTTIASAQATTSLALTTAGAVAQTGAIATPALSISAAGPVSLPNVENDIGSLQVSSGGGAIGVVDASDLAIAGVDAGGAGVDLTVGGTGSLTQTGALVDVGTFTANVAGAVTLTNTGNAIASLGRSTAGSGFSLYDSNGVDVAGAVATVSGDLVVRAAGDLTLDTGGTLQATSGNLVASTEGRGNFINDSSAEGAALVVGSGDRWLVYSDTPDLVSGPHTVKGGLTSGFRDYDATYSMLAPADVTQSGDGFIYSYATPTLTVTATISGTPSQTYGSAPTATLGYTASGLVDSEDTLANVITGGTPAYSTSLANTMNAGTYEITYESGLTSSNYNLVAGSTPVTYTVNPAVLTYTATPASRVYGAANPALTGTVTGFVLGQNSSVLSGTPVWSTPATTSSNVGQYAISGSGYSSPSGNYTFQEAAGNATALTITPAALTVTASDDTITYDGASFTGGNGVTYSGFVNGDTSAVLQGTLSYGGSAQGARNVGSYAIAPSGLTAGNYTIDFVSGTLTIDKANLVLQAGNATKTYDGTLAASDTVSAVDGTQLFGSDTVSGGTFAYTNANAGSGDKTVTVSGVTVNDGNGGNNYAVSYIANSTSTINPAPITVSTSNVTKTYDGTTAASGSPVLVSGTLYRNVSNGDTQDALSGGTFAFTDPNAGVGNKTVTVSGVTLSDGNGGNNYIVTYAPNTTSTIDPASLTVAAEIASKTYDGTDAATVSGYTLTGLVGDQTLDVSGTAAFSDPNAGTAKAVTVSDITLANGTNGGLASNYTVASTVSATGTIDPKALTADPTVANKVYDGTTAADLTSLNLSGFVGNQTVTAVATGSVTFADKNVGTAVPVTISGVELVNGTNGGLATNYTIPSTVTGSANITPATLTIAGAVAENKVYDGTTTATLDTQSAVLTGVIGSDDVQIGSLTGTFATKNVGNNIPIGTGTVVLTGTDAMDYTLVQPTGLTADITPRPLTVSATGVNKVYDGTTAASVVLSDNALPGDDLALASTNSFLDKNAGNNKFVNVSDITVSGPDAEDYTWNTSTSTYASITPATLTVTATGVNKPYDGTTAATVTLTDSPSAGDQISVAYAGATFDSADPGNGKPITVDGIYLAGGADAGNYVLASTTATATADIVGTVSPPPTVTDTTATKTGEWSLPPPVPQASPSLAPTQPPAVLDVSLPAGFGERSAATSGSTPGNTTGTALAGNSQSPGGSAAGVAEAGAEAQSLGGSTEGTEETGTEAQISGGSTQGTAETGTASAGSLPSSGIAAGGESALERANAAAAGEGAVGGDASETGGDASGTGGGAAASARDGTISVAVVPAESPLKGLITVSVPEEVIDTAVEFHFPLPAELATAAQRKEVKVTRMNGRKLPSWLRYVPKTRTFVATEMPQSALPFEVMVRIGAQSWAVLITERYRP